jgi:ABC-type branched-subunit amino acid transport system substrate-binding protein
MVLAYATERTDGTASAVRAYLKSQHEYQGVIGPIAFDERGDVKTGHYQIVDAAK